ncbi:MAG: hypothetical protein ACRD2N_20040 [Vicinamibacterales bacterium]
MTDTRATSETRIPSARTLAIATGVAVLVAGLILVTIVLPAEYGIDPLGTGRMLGLDVMTASIADEPLPTDPDALKMVPTANGPIATYPGGFRVDSREIALEPYEYKEFKYRLEKGATMMFSWRSSGDLVHDFHGDADGASAEAAQSYDKQPHRHADGSFVAPFSGIHGWFWENPGDQAVTITLTTAGFYTAAHEFHMDRRRFRHEVGGLERITKTPAAREGQ